MLTSIRLYPPLGSPNQVTPGALLIVPFPNCTSSNEDTLRIAVLSSAAPVLAGPCLGA